MGTLGENEGTIAIYGDSGEKQMEVKSKDGEQSIINGKLATAQGVHSYMVLCG